MKKNITLLTLAAIIGVSTNFLQPNFALAQAKKAPQKELKKPEPKQEPTIHLIQLAAYKGTPTGDYSKLAKLGSIYSEKGDKGLNKVVLGDFKTLEEAQKNLKTAHELGFKEAFLITKKAKPETTADKKDDKKVSADKPADKKDDKKVSADKPTDKKDDKKVSADKPTDKKDDKKVSADKPADKKDDKKVSADKPADKKDDKKSEASNQPIFIQLGAYKDVALEQFKNVTELGSLYLDTDKEGFSKIRLGKFADTEQARKTLIEVRKRGYHQAFLILAPPPAIPASAQK